MSEETSTATAPDGDDMTPKAKAPDHGQDPRTVPGTPQAAAAEALGEHVPPEGSFVDMEMRKRVNKLKSRGLACVMGPDFPGGQIGIRPWSARAIQIYRETYESRLRVRNPKLRKDDPLPAKDAIELNRATAAMSVVFLKCKFKMAGGKTVTFDGTEDGEKVRDFISQHLLIPYDANRPETADEIDMEFLDLIMSLNRGLSKVPYQEIDRLGEGFVFGLTEQLDYSDSLQ